MLTSILWLATATVFGWLFFMFVLKPFFRFSFVQKPFAVFSYFVLLTVGISYLFFPTPLLLYKDPPLFPIATLVVVLGFCSQLYVRAKAKLASTEQRFAHRDLELLCLDQRFLFSKSADVFFQQTVAGILILTLSTSFSLLILSLLFSVLFAVAHMGLLFRIPHDWFVYFLLCALVGGALMPYFILYVAGGIYYTIAFHVLWYAITGVFFRTHARA